MLAVFFIIGAIPHEYTVSEIVSIACLYEIWFGILYWTWLMTALYPTMLNIYIQKLSLLNEGCEFSEVKKAIKCREVLWIILITAASVVYIIVYVGFVLIVFWGWIEDLNSKTTDCASEMCDTLSLISHIKNWLDFGIETFLFVLQLYMYTKLKLVMKRRLHYYYQLTRKSIILMFISWCSFFFFRMMHLLFYAIVKEDRYKAYIGLSKLTFDQSLALLIIFVFTTTFLAIQSYLITKHMDFAYYVWAWMVGYKVANKFDKMSIFIKPSSCFKKDDGEDSDSIDNDLISNGSDSEMETTAEHL